MRARKSTHEDLTGEGKYYEYRIFHGKYGDAMEFVKALQKWIAKLVNRVGESSLASTKLNRYCDEE